MTSITTVIASSLKDVQIKILLFDMDNTLCDSGNDISAEMISSLKKVHELGYVFGVVGGGTYAKLMKQIGDNINLFKYIFAECGSVAYITDKHVNTNSIRIHKLYPHMNKLIKLSLSFISKQSYSVSGNIIDVRNGLIYISLVGLQARQDERDEFIKLDKINHIRDDLFKLLKHASKDVFGLSITYGGAVGLSIYPSEYDKVQVLEYFKDVNCEIHYFGDKYMEGGNDYNIMIDKRVIGHKVDNYKDTIKELENMIKIVKV